MGEIRLDGEWVDLISSEAKPKISSALADFTLASARISFMREFEVIRKTSEKIFFIVLTQKKALAIASAFFSYIRLAASDINLQAVLVANIISLKPQVSISLSRSENITVP